MQAYSVESIIGGIGYLRTTERLAVRQALGGESTIDVDQVSAQMHLYWTVSADGLDSALDAARSTLRDAAQATGVYTPHYKSFCVREMDQ